MATAKRAHEEEPVTTTAKTAKVADVVATEPAETEELKAERKAGAERRAKEREKQEAATEQEHSPSFFDPRSAPAQLLDGPPPSGMLTATAMLALHNGVMALARNTHSTDSRVADARSLLAPVDEQLTALGVEIPPG